MPKKTRARKAVHQHSMGANAVTLIAQFGITTFAIRTGARIRDDKVAFEKLASVVS